MKIQLGDIKTPPANTLANLIRMVLGSPGDERTERMLDELYGNIPVQTRVICRNTMSDAIGGLL